MAPHVKKIIVQEGQCDIITNKLFLHVNILSVNRKEKRQENTLKNKDTRREEKKRKEKTLNRPATTTR